MTTQIFLSKDPGQTAWIYLESLAPEKKIIVNI